ncbi:MAG: TonB-dependent receptor [Cyclobacteriaceae bacterium]
MIRYFVCLFLGAYMLLCISASAQEVERTIQLDSVLIIGITPLESRQIPLSEIAVNVQTADDAALKLSQNRDLTQFLNRNFGSVHVNEPGGNPLQPDFNFRGFQASPLLGLPQGLSVYLDGVRVNEMFGEVVNWDLIPQSAIGRVELMPGSNPLYGLNTLGGALSLRTKSGFTDTGHGLSLLGGSYGRFQAEASSGGSRGNLAYFASVNHFREEGWRDFSASEASNAFFKGSWAKGNSTLDFTTLLGSSDLRGNGATPVELLEQSREAVFTHPDNTRNRLAMFNLQGAHTVNNHLQMNAVAYFRLKDTRTFNGDDTPYEAEEDGFLYLESGLEEDEDEELPEEEEEEGEPVIDQFGNPIAATEAVSSATNNRSRTLERTYGASVQMTYTKPLKGKRSRFVAGISFDGGYASFNSDTELARLTENRGTEGSGVYDGNSFTEVDVVSEHASIYFSEYYYPTDKIGLSLSGRFHRSRIQLRDQLGTALNGDHHYNRFNPAAGITYGLGSASLYASYSISARTPTPVEFTCADPDAPCRLPNAFLADPPLDLVIAHTLEMGIRGYLPGNIGWVANGFLTNVNNDIYFISAGPFRNSGYFTNIGNTRRWGVELSLNRSIGRFTAYAHYTYLQATFEEDFSVNSPFHPLGEAGEIEVSEGNRIPLIPNHIAKLGMSYNFTPRIRLGGDLIYNSSFHIRGDESNQLEQVEGYTLLNLNASYQPAQFINLFVRASNVLNTEFATFGLLGEPDEIAQFEDFENPLFQTPGTPFMLQAGLELRF